MAKNEKAGMLVPALPLQEFAPATMRIPFADAGVCSCDHGNSFCRCRSLLLRP